MKIFRGIFVPVLFIFLFSGCASATSAASIYTPVATATADSRAGALLQNIQNSTLTDAQFTMNWQTGATSADGTGKFTIKPYILDINLTVHSRSGSSQYEVISDGNNVYQRQPGATNWVDLGDTTLQIDPVTQAIQIIPYTDLQSQTQLAGNEQVGSVNGEKITAAISTLDPETVTGAPELSGQAVLVVNPQNYFPLQFTETAGGTDENGKKILISATFVFSNWNSGVVLATPAPNTILGSGNE